MDDPAPIKVTSPALAAQTARDQAIAQAAFAFAALCVKATEALQLMIDEDKR